MNQLESIYDNVDRQLKEEVSLLSGVEAEYGELHLEDHTMDVTVKLIPKRISEDMKVSVSINGRYTELTRSGNCFAGTIAVDNSIIPVRFNNRPETVLVTLRNMK